MEMMDDAFSYDVEFAAIAATLRLEGTGAFSRNAWYILEVGIPAIVALHWAHEDYVTWEGMLWQATRFPGAPAPGPFWSEVVEQLYNDRPNEVGNDEQP